MRASRLISAGRTIPLVLALAAGCTDDGVGPGAGAIRFSLTTSGVDLDPDGYGVSVDGKPRGGVGAKGSVTISGIEPGTHTARLEGVAANCSVGGGAEHVVTVGPGKEVTAAFAVSCTALVGSLRVTTVTSGDEPDEDGYILEFQQGLTQRIGASTSITIPSVRVGPRVVSLRDVAPNCAVVEPSAPVATVTFGGTAEVTFTIRCLATGSLQVTSATSGPDPDPDGYTMRIEGGNVTTSAPLPASGTVTTRGLPYGSYRVTLTGVAENCEPAGPRTRAVDVPTGATAAVAFELACAPVTQLAFVSERDGNPEIYVVNSNGSGLVRLTYSSARDVQPSWSPDGQRIAFASDRQGSFEIYVMNADGSNVVRRTSSGAPNTNPVWSPDGRRIAFVGVRNSNADIYTVATDDDGSAPVRLTSDPALDTDPAWSPDGGKIAFTSYRTGNPDIHVMNADGSGVTRLTRSSFSDGYQLPSWSPDGRRIAAVWSSCYYYYYYCYGDLDLTIRVMNADGSRETNLASLSTLDDVAPAWSPDGRTIAFATQICDGGRCPVSVVYVRADGSYTDLIVRDGYSPSWRR